MKTKLFEQMSAVTKRLIRVLITAKRPRAQMPKPLGPQFPDACAGGALAKRPISHNIGPILMPALEEASYFARLQYDAAAIGPQFIRFPAPQLMEQPGAPLDANPKSSRNRCVSPEKIRDQATAPVSCAPGSGEPSSDGGRRNCWVAGQVWRRGITADESGERGGRCPPNGSGNGSEARGGSGRRMAADCSSPS